VRRRGRAACLCSGPTLNEAAERDLDLARELLVAESGAGGNAGPERRRQMESAQAVAGGERVLQQLQLRLTLWFGPDGVDALLLRAVDRTVRSHPITAGIRREGTGPLTLHGLLAGSAPDSAVVTEGVVALIATILALIARLIGEDMTRQLVHQIWPQAASAESLSSEGSNDSAKVET
jgi:hypothetical protein